MDRRITYRFVIIPEGSHLGGWLLFEIEYERGRECGDRKVVELQWHLRKVMEACC